MVSWINPLNVSWEVWGLTLLVAFLAGLSKSGLKGIVMIGIPLLAKLYGAKESTGIILPFLIFGDLFALKIFFKNSKFSLVAKLLPYTLIGVVLAVFIGNKLDNHQFIVIIATILLVCIAIIFYTDIRKSPTSIFEHKSISPIFGLGGGFATMMGNLAGPIFNLYLISMKLSKKEFIGTGAIFYLILNVFKLPFHYFAWGSVTLPSLQMNVVMMPAVLAGSLLGSRLVKYIPDKAYRYFILTVTAISAILLYIR